jgi:hypothetical protein
MVKNTNNTRSKPFDGETMMVSRVPVALLIALVFCCARTAGGKGSHPSLHVHFSAEDTGLEKPVPIPQAR